MSDAKIGDLRAKIAARKVETEHGEAAQFLEDWMRLAMDAVQTDLLSPEDIILATRRLEFGLLFMEYED